MADQFKTIDWKQKDGVGHLVLNQPPSNPMDNDFFLELEDFTHHILPTSNLKALLVYGKGRHFSSGADLNDLLSNLLAQLPDNGRLSQEPFPEFLMKNMQTFRVFSQQRFPVISVISGVCLGAAFELALNCHIRICAGNALLGLPESSFNLLPGLGGIQNVLFLSNPMKTFEIVLGGGNFTAQEAWQWKLVDKVLDRKSVLDYAQELAKFIGPEYYPVRKPEYLLGYERSLQSSGN